MKKTSGIGIIEALCAVNLVLLVCMVYATSYNWDFNEQRAVVASLLWLFSIVLAVPAAIYGIVSARTWHKATHRSKTVRVVICWLTIAANGAVVVSMFVR